MKKEVLDLFKCPNCGNEHLDVVYAGCSDSKCALKCLQCALCAAEYVMDSAGIMELLPANILKDEKDKEKYKKFKGYWEQFKDGFPEMYDRYDSENFIEFADINSDECVLEIGIGGGHTPEYIAGKTENSFYIDFDRKAIASQKKKITASGHL